MVGERSAGGASFAASASLERRMNPAISLARVPPLVPARGLAWSGGLHVATIATLALAHLFFPVDLPLIAPLRGDFVELARSESISLPGFHTSDVGRQAAGASPRSGGTSQNKRAVPSHALPPRVEVSTSSAPAFSGPQEIVSDLPDATNSVQTIRRPDMSFPPRLRFPQLLQSIVAGPPAETPPLVAPPPFTPLTEVIAVEEKIIVKPSLVVPLAQRPRKEISPKAPKVNVATTATPPIMDVHPRMLPALAMEVQTIASKTAVIINAIIVPNEAPVRIPDAELSGIFAVKPTSSEPSKVVASVNGRGTGGGPAKGSTANSATADDGNGRTNVASESVTGTGTAKGSGPVGAGTATAKTSSKGVGSGPDNSSGGSGGNGRASGTGTGVGTHPGAGAGTEFGNGNSRSGNGLPGITIIGGSGGRGGGSIPSTQRSTRPGYDITIISGGSSGGASRDTGVFSRSETVYSVYIRMNDAAGGGPDWSMQYALLGSAPGGNGMLTPPIAVKKVAASVVRDPAQSYDNRIFITGTISETGELTGLRAIRAADVSANAALKALQQWQFLPAQLDGRAVPAKVLIGVTLIVQ